MNETQIKQAITETYEFCKAEYEESETKLAATPMDHENWQLENYMTGYHKGRFRMIEHLKSAIQ